jgi:hypothetical protein
VSSSSPSIAFAVIAFPAILPQNPSFLDNKRSRISFKLLCLDYELGRLTCFLWKVIFNWFTYLPSQVQAFKRSSAPIITLKARSQLSLSTKTKPINIRTFCKHTRLWTYSQLNVRPILCESRTFKFRNVFLVDLRSRSSHVSWVLCDLHLIISSPLGEPLYMKTTLLVTNVCPQLIKSLYKHVYIRRNRKRVHMLCAVIKHAGICQNTKEQCSRSAS